MAAINEQDLLWVYNPTTSPYTIHWGGYPYTLQSAEKRLFPRFIAEHFAKYLADAILLRQEQKLTEKDGKPHALLNHPVERPRVLGLINLGVYSYFHDEDKASGAAIARMVDEVASNADMSQAPAIPELNDKDYEDLGLVPNRALGTLDAPKAPTTDEIGEVLASTSDGLEKPENTGDLLPEPGSEGTGDQMPPVIDDSLTNTKKPQKTRAELVEEAGILGIEITSRMTVNQIEAAIRNF